MVSAVAVRDIQLSSDGDRVVVAGDYALADGAQAVKQGIECRLRLFRGEYWLDEQLGVDWLGRILVRSPDALVVKAELSRAILSTPDVTRVSSTAYAEDRPARRATASFEAASTEGTVVGEVSVLP